MAQPRSSFRDMDILEYYHSPHANAGAQSSSDESERAIPRYRPPRSSSSDDYDPSHRLSTITVRGGIDVPLAMATPHPDHVSPGTDMGDMKRRPSARAAANAENRRLAVVELNRHDSDESTDYPSNESSSDLLSSSDASRRAAKDGAILSRRGMCFIIVFAMSS